MQYAWRQGGSPSGQAGGLFHRSKVRCKVFLFGATALTMMALTTHAYAQCAPDDDTLAYPGLRNGSDGFEFIFETDGIGARFQTVDVLNRQPTSFTPPATPRSEGFCGPRRGFNSYEVAPGVRLESSPLSGQIINPVILIALNIGNGVGPLLANEDYTIDFDITIGEGASIFGQSDATIWAFFSAPGFTNFKQRLNIINFGLLDGNDILEERFEPFDSEAVEAFRGLYATILILNDDNVIGTLSVENWGVIRTRGSLPVIKGANYGDDIFNAGLIVGDIDFLGGNDIYTAYSNGRTEGSIDGGEDFDIAAFEQFSGNVIVDNYTNFERLDISSNGVAVIGGNAGISDSFTELFIRQGRTNIAADISLDTTVLANGVLGGNGAIFGDVNVLGGVVAPGASIGTITFNGDVTFDPASVLEIEFDTSGNDHLIVNGDVLIQGSTLSIVSLGETPISIQTFEFLNVSGDITGAFSMFDLVGFTGFAETIELSPGILSVIVTPQVGFGASLSDNASASADYWNSFIINGGANAASDDIISSLFAIGGTVPALESTLLSLQPEAYAATAAIGVEQSFLAVDLVRGRVAGFTDRRDGKYFWLSGAGGFARYDEDVAGDGASSFSVDSHAIIAGAEIVRSNTILGAFGGSLDTDQHLRLLNAETTADGFIFGGYGAWSDGKFTTGASLSYILGDTETIRRVSLLNETLRSDYTYDVLTVQAQTHYDISTAFADLVPEAGLTYIRTDRNSVSETGGSAALEIAGGTEKFLYLDLGGEISKHFMVGGDIRMRTALSAGWRYEMLNQSIDVTSALSGTSNFGLRSVATDFDRSRLRMGGEVSINLGGRVEFFANYRGEFGTNYTENRISGGLAMSL